MTDQIEMTDQTVDTGSRGFVKRLLPKLVLLGASMVFVMLMLEVGVRVARLEGDFFFQLDPLVGATYIPNKKGWHSFPDGRQWVEINSIGYRDSEWAVEKPDGTKRIVMLGDSYLASMEVPREDRLSDLMEAGLGERCPSPIEVMNFGVTGFGTAQQLETLRHRALDYQPDLVVLMFYAGNDLYNNSFELDPEPNRLHYVLEEDGSLRRLPYTVRDNSLKGWLRHHSRAYLFVRGQIMRYAALHRALAKLGMMQGQDEEAEEQRGEAATVAQLEDAQNLQDGSGPIDRAWKLTKALILETRSVANASGSEFALVLVPTQEQIADRGAELSRAPGGGRRQRASRELASLCEEEGLPCFDLTTTFVEAGTELPGLFFENGGHWTPEGQQFARDGIEPWVSSQLCEESESVTGELGG